MAVSASGHCAGILALAPKDEEIYVQWGARYFAWVATGIITKALKDLAQDGQSQLVYWPSHCAAGATDAPAG